MNGSLTLLLAVFDELMQWTFLRWYIDPRNPHSARETFAALGQEERGSDKQKSLLCQILDKNMLYVNASELDNAEFAVPDEDKSLTRDFFEKTPRPV